MVAVSPKKKKNVQSATEQKPENATRPTEEAEPKPEPAQVASKEEAPTVDVKEAPQKLIEIPEIDEDSKKMLYKATGMNWGSVTQAFEKVNIWAESVDARFSIILQKMPTEKGIADELVKRSIKERQKQPQQMQQQQASTGKEGEGGMGLGSIMKLADKFIGGDSASNPMNEKIMNMAIESMGLGNALVKAIILKTAPELAAQLLPPLGAAKT